MTDRDQAREEQRRVSWFGITLTLVLILLVIAHVMWPQIIVLRYAANVMVLIVGSVLLSALSEQIQGVGSFSLPLLWMLLVLIVGVVLFTIYGWVATSWVLGAYAVVCVLSGVFGRVTRLDG